MTIAANKWPSKSLNVGEVHLRARYTGGGASANMTKAAGRGISSVAYNAAAGCYLITFTEVGKVFLGGNMSVLSATGTTTAYVAHPIAYSSTAKTLSIYVSDLATPTAHDLSTSEELWVHFVWADSDAA